MLSTTKRRKKTKFVIFTCVAASSIQKLTVTKILKAVGSLTISAHNTQMKLIRFIIFCSCGMKHSMNSDPISIVLVWMWRLHLRLDFWRLPYVLFTGNKNRLKARVKIYFPRIIHFEAVFKCDLCVNRREIKKISNDFFFVNFQHRKKRFFISDWIDLIL